MLQLVNGYRNGTKTPFVFSHRPPGLATNAFFFLFLIGPTSTNICLLLLFLLFLFFTNFFFSFLLYFLIRAFCEPYKIQISHCWLWPTSSHMHLKFFLFLFLISWTNSYMDNSFAFVWWVKHWCHMGIVITLEEKSNILFDWYKTIFFFFLKVWKMLLNFLISYLNLKNI